MWLERVASWADRLWGPPLRALQSLVEQLGAHLLLLWSVFRWAIRPPYRLAVLLEAMVFIGFESLPIVLLISLFVGAVFALQLSSALRTFRAEAFTGATVGLALTRELAPVFTSIVVSARAGAGMATELGSMRITEQIDALATMAINPLQYLIVPRVVAGTLMVPMLTMLFNCVGMLGAYIVSVGVQNVDKGVFLANARWLLDPNDITQGMVKAVVFGCVLTLIACNQGYNASGGAKGVGVATTRAVVGSFVTVLILDYFMTDMWLTFFNRAARG
ncbi:MAG: ABC transporter permease [Deltaproteobacteria bacterium]|jgi:phospholipid/cholesterol/gamma-HCH transport system permease protein|nr:ABC transporter permease [Deltaproteobacteria bacterium]